MVIIAYDKNYQKVLQALLTDAQGHAVQANAVFCRFELISAGRDATALRQAEADRYFCPRAEFLRQTKLDA